MMDIEKLNMKSFYTNIILLLFPLLIMAETPTQQQGAVITFKETTYDFGEIIEGGGENGIYSCDFEFENTGTEDLIIYAAKSSGGGQVAKCKILGISIPPKEKGVITVIYSTRGKVGRFNKSITVITNATQNTVILYIKGEVIPKEENN